MANHTLCFHIQISRLRQERSFLVYNQEKLTVSLNHISIRPMCSSVTTEDIHGIRLHLGRITGPTLQLRSNCCPSSTQYTCPALGLAKDSWRHSYQTLCTYCPVWNEFDNRNTEANSESVQAMALNSFQKYCLPVYLNISRTNIRPPVILLSITEYIIRL
jgi:hypothetical protein